MVYDNIINRVIALRPQVTLNSWNESGQKYEPEIFPAVTWMSPPTSSIHSYDPSSVTIKQKFDPTKGRNFTRLRNEGRILTSPYQVVNITTQDYLAQCDHEFRGHGWAQTGRIINGQTVCVDYLDTSSYLKCSWTEQGDFHYWSKALPDKNYIRSEISASDIQDAITLSQQDAMAQALTGYDPLTELFELKDVLRFLVSNVGSAAALLAKLRNKDPVAWWKGRNLNAKQLLKSTDKGLRELGNHWMEYRYALMPIIYSMKDILEVSKGDIKWKTSRSKQVLTPTMNIGQTLQTTLAERCMYTDLTGTITVRSHVKQRYDIDGIANLFGARLTVNPFITAWELTTLSFVVDWFLNIGDLITNATSPNLAAETGSVTSIRTETVSTTYLKDHSADVKLSSWAATACIGAQSYTETFQRNVDLPLRVVTNNSYNRFLFTQPELRVIFDVNLNWKRILDGLVLSYQPFKSLLRSLK